MFPLRDKSNERVKKLFLTVVILLFVVFLKKNSGENNVL